MRENDVIKNLSVINRNLTIIKIFSTLFVLFFILINFIGRNYRMDFLNNMDFIFHLYFISVLIFLDLLFIQYKSSKLLRDVISNSINFNIALIIIILAINLLSLIYFHKSPFLISNILLYAIIVPLIFINVYITLIVRDFKLIKLFTGIALLLSITLLSLMIIPISYILLEPSLHLFIYIIHKICVIFIGIKFYVDAKFNKNLDSLVMINILLIIWFFLECCFIKDIPNYEKLIQLIFYLSLISSTILLSTFIGLWTITNEAKKKFSLILWGALHIPLFSYFYISILQYYDIRLSEIFPIFINKIGFIIPGIWTIFGVILTFLIQRFKNKKEKEEKKNN